MRYVPKILKQGVFFPKLIILLQYLLCFSLELRNIIYIEKINHTVVIVKRKWVVLIINF